MANSSTEILIEQLRGNKRFFGTCPKCGEDFKIADTTLFPLKGSRPDEALAAISHMRKRIKDKKIALAAAKEKMTHRAERTAHAVNLGKIVEKIVPSFSSFSYQPSDCRALFEPIDYLVFSGLTKSSKVDVLHFVDIKSGGARLNQNQKRIKEAVEAGKISYCIYPPKKRGK
jgi:predicted Holliday junction resolvase-like endonuclease